MKQIMLQDQMSLKHGRISVTKGNRWRFKVREWCVKGCEVGGYLALDGAEKTPLAEVIHPRVVTSISSPPRESEVRCFGGRGLLYRDNYWRSPTSSPPNFILASSDARGDYDCDTMHVSHNPVFRSCRSRHDFDKFTHHRMHATTC